METNYGYGGGAPDNGAAPQPRINLRPERYTMKWLGERLAVMAFIVICFASAMLICGELADGRMYAGLLSEGAHALCDDSIDYGVGVMAISLLALVLVEIGVRRPVTYVQYVLVALAQVLFYPLLIALAGLAPFAVAYVVVVAMTVALIEWFVWGLTCSVGSTAVMGVVLLGLYGVTGVLLYLGEMALLTGSLVAFALVALGMYFTLRLKVEDGQIYLK